MKKGGGANRHTESNHYRVNRKVLGRFRDKGSTEKQMGARSLEESHGPSKERERVAAVI